MGRELAEAVSPAEYAALQRATQYAHYTPEPIIRALWRAVRHLGFTGGCVLEPGMGTGLFFALIPVELRETIRLTGIEYCPVTARIARLVHPEARITPAARSAAASIWRSVIRLSRTASFGPTRRPRPSASACTTTSSPARSRGCARAASPSS
jgi:hypothetical protein